MSSAGRNIISIGGGSRTVLFLEYMEYLSEKWLASKESSRDTVFNIRKETEFNY